MSLLTLLVVVIVVSVVLWAVRTLLVAFDVSNPMAGVVMVIAVVVLLLFALTELGLIAGRVFHL